MKAICLAALGVILLLSSPATAQSTLTFARVMDPADFPLTGFAVVNPTAAEARVNFTLYDSKGNAAGLSTRSIPAGGQIAKVGSELFPGITTGGWVQATSDTPNLRGFWLGGDWVNTTDGTETAASASQLVLPLVTAQTEIDLVNTTQSSEAILIRLYGSEGQEIAEPHIDALSPFGFYKARAATIFSTADLTQATHAKVTCAVSCAASALVSNFVTAPSLAVTNGVNASSAAKEFYFPHVLKGQLDSLVYTTIMSVTNLSATAQTITLTYRPEFGGDPFEVTRELLPNATLREILASLFQLTNDFDNGWVRVTAEQPVAAVAIISELNNKSTAASPGLPAASTNLILGHIADLDPWWTGVALLNPSGADILVDVFAISPSGTLIGQKSSILIPALSKTAMLLSQWIPQTTTRSSDGGFVFIRSASQVFALELFFTRDQKVLSHVPAFPLGASERFTPPNR